ncbi:MAG: SCO family protein, partial [Thermoflexales bacterium]
YALVDMNGQPFKLSQLKGRSILIFFGYTFCPDVCPLTLAELKQVKALLGPNAVDVAMLYISVDPERDSPEVLKRYIGAFDPDFLSATSDIETVRRFGAEFGAAFEKQKPAGTSASYLVAHTSFTYLLDRDGRWRMTFAFKTPVEEVARETLRIAQER